MLLKVLPRILCHSLLQLVVWRQGCCQALPLSCLQASGGRDDVQQVYRVPGSVDVRQCVLQRLATYARGQQHQATAAAQRGSGCSGAACMFP